MVVVVLLWRVVLRSVSSLRLGRLVLVGETVPCGFEEAFVLVRICRRSTVARTRRGVAAMRVSISISNACNVLNIPVHSNIHDTLSRLIAHLVCQYFKDCSLVFIEVLWHLNLKLHSEVTS